MGDQAPLKSVCINSGVMFSEQCPDAGSKAICGNSDAARIQVRSIY